MASTTTATEKVSARNPNRLKKPVPYQAVVDCSNCGNTIFGPEHRYDGEEKLPYMSACQCWRKKEDAQMQQETKEDADTTSRSIENLLVS